MATEILTLANPAFKAFLFYAAINLLKMSLVVLTVAYHRLTNHVYITPEDVKAFSPDRDKKPVYDDERVERARRSHQNDLENIPVYIFLSTFLLFTGCSAATAIWHFRIFTVSRILFSLCYAFVIPSPSRTLCFTVGVMVNFSMLVRILMATWS